MKYRFCRILLTLLTILLLCSTCAVAAEYRGDTNFELPAGSTIDDDLLVGGSNVGVAGKVNGDLFAAGSQLSFTGSTTGSSMLAGQQVTSFGTVGNDLLAAGTSITISSKVADNGWAYGNMLAINDNASFGKDLAVAGAMVTVNGHVGRDLLIGMGNATINGTVGRDLKAYGARLIIGPQAVIRGNLIYSDSPPAKISPGAKILGKIIYERPTKHTGRKRHHFGLLAGLWLYSLISSFIVGCILLAIAPRLALSVSERLFAVPWWSLLTGFLIFIGVPIAIFALVITILGIPLALILLALYAVSIFFSLIFTAFTIGRWIFNRARRTGTSIYLELLVGLVVLWLLMSIPVLGVLIKWSAELFGLGALYTVFYHRLRADKERMPANSA